MARGKRSMPESKVSSDDVMLADESAQGISASSKNLSLPEPVLVNESFGNADNSETPVDSSKNAVKNKPKQNTRPKVGRSSSANKKQKDSELLPPELPMEDSTDAASENVAIKEKDVPKMPEINVPEVSALPQQRLFSEAVIIEETSALEGKSDNTVSVAQTVPQEEAQTEFPEEWAQEHTRPWSFKSILFWVVLFILINVGIMTLFTVHHKPKVSAALPAPAMTASTEPTAPEGNPATTNTVMPPGLPGIPSVDNAANAGATETSGNIPPAALPVTTHAAGANGASLSEPSASSDAAPAPNPEKSGNPQELLSIIDKN